MVFGIEIGIWRRREGEGKARVRGDSLYTEGIRRRMINYWYSVVTAECSVGLPLFFVFYFFSFTKSLSFYQQILVSVFLNLTKM